ncbi:NAD(P)H-dependent flavin oxidoreductase [Pseudomonas viridiflava]|uniref:NAD(P)H-dependent flavin oxidoreductase n=1 Tax=Pseudomonas syringae group TaxID=136849 RepID=UPI000F02D278|nr:nitronate monooxygenase [Pseudomonas viridiflava]MCQ9390550.1 nitronate monooxygenase [Pseudomonas viridiflava]
MSYLNTALTRAFKVQHPVVLAPMGGASGGELAAAVSRAGGLGLVGASYGDPEWMAAQLPHMKEVTQPWGIGLVMFTVAKRMELLGLALDYGPNVVALSFGDVRPFISPIRESGAKVIVQVHDVDQALYALDAGVDALIVQGAEAGGHSLRRSSMPLFPAVRDAVGPEAVLIGTGGIADGRGCAAAFALGMDGVMLGTRFLASQEALPSMKVKETLLRTVASQTVRTRLFDEVRGIDWPTGYSGRAIANRFSSRWVGNEEAFHEAGQTVRDDYADALKKDDVDIKAIWAGEVADLIKDILPAQAIIENLMTDTALTLESLQGKFKH